MKENNEKKTTFTIHNEIAKKFRIFALQNDLMVVDAVEAALEEFMNNRKEEK